MSVQEHVTTALDTAGVLVIAAAPLLGLWPLIGGWATAPAGVALLVGSWWADGGAKKLLRRRDGKT